MKFSVFLPKDALEKDACPVLYFLPGAASSEQEIIQKSAFQRFAARYGVIVVCPDTSPRGEAIADDSRDWIGQGCGFYANATQAPYAENYQMFDYISEELPDVINNSFPTNGLQSISGHLSGGHGALYIGLSQSENYRSVSAFSPFYALSSNEQGKDVSAAYFGSDSAQYDAVDPCELIKTADRLPILIEQGTVSERLDEDFIAARLKAAAEEADYHIEINIREGYDDSYYLVQSYIMEHFVFHAEYLDAN